MISQELTLIVPFEKETRLEIRRQTEAFFRVNNVMPPVYYDAISDYAAMLIEKHHWDKQYQAFVMVCCGNAIWRKVVAAVPYNRRILLLPQCLKNSKQCTAIQDDLGLLCNECGKCSLSGLLKEAENLGYVALVTEGTTITTRLIESGKVDAVIGVGCMEVLQKMFVSVSKYSIPGIGIPLLTCGCVDTNADEEWIKEELYCFHENNTIRLMNLNWLRNITSSIFGEEQLTRTLGPAKTQTEKLARESLLNGGQRLRPLITVLAYEAFCPTPDPNAINRLSLSVECFHKASLIHDDIEDGDEFRYGKETIHARYGIPVAINIGDLLIGEGYRLIAESDFQPQMVQLCTSIIAQGHRTLTIGQGTELLAIKDRKVMPLNDILQVFENKTAAAFKVALLLGATAGGADHETLEKLDGVSNAIGIAYQIKDDLQDFTDQRGIIEHQRPSILLSMLYDTVTEVEKGVLQKAVQTNDTETVHAFIERYNIHFQTEELLRDYISRAKQGLANLENLGLKLALHEILGKIFKDYI
ncbi:MAG: polyprenyl synthetase family protein [Bacteroidota bacterium]|nr:polyprenyl synthetase family protein [Bacteroidota bacterium]